MLGKKKNFGKCVCCCISLAYLHLTFHCFKYVYGHINDPTSPEFISKFLVKTGPFLFYCWVAHLQFHFFRPLEASCTFALTFSMNLKKDAKKMCVNDPGTAAVEDGRLRKGLVKHQLCRSEALA